MSDSFHGTPITPNWLLANLGEPEPWRRKTLLRTFCFCVSYWRPDQIELVAGIARRVMIDCGAFSIWMANLRAHLKWVKGGRVGLEPEPVIVDAAFRAGYYAFLRHWMPRLPPDSFFVIFDEIDAGSQIQDALLDEVPEDLLPYAWPVWHMDEPISRAINLSKRFGRFCIGSTGEFMVVGSSDWRLRMDELFNALAGEFGPKTAGNDNWPLTHMLRGLQCEEADYDYPFDQDDSTNLGRNHNRLNEEVGDLAGMTKQELFEAQLWRWERLSCPTSWPPLRLKHKRPKPPRPSQQLTFLEQAA